MADPLVCVSLEGTTVKEMLDEAARAGIAGADMIEVRFDRLYLSRPEPTVTENEEGEITKTMPPAGSTATPSQEQNKQAPTVVTVAEPTEKSYDDPFEV